jgi:hypothetical protein
MLESSPRTRKVVVPDDPEALLEAINDRAITWLLVEQCEPAPIDLRRETRASARNRIRGAFAIRLGVS